MNEQNYENHVRYYPLHHFVFYPLILVLIIFSFGYGIQHPGQEMISYGFAMVFFLIGWLSYMVRQHYALTNQDRIVRLELRLRYYRLTREPFEKVEDQLCIQQIVALRYASDNELVLLVDRTLRQNLSAREIKKAVIEWVPDNLRV